MEHHIFGVSISHLWSSPRPTWTVRDSLDYGVFDSSWHENTYQAVPLISWEIQYNGAIFKQISKILCTYEIKIYVEAARKEPINGARVE